MKCELENITVHYESFGQGRPILFLHGWSLDHRVDRHSYEPIFDSRDGWRRLYLDMPGHGRTTGEAWIHGHDQILEVVLAFIDAVIPGERFAIAGTSLGAYTARGVVSRRLERVDGLLLRIPVIITDDVKRQLPESSPLIVDPDFMESLSPEEIELFGDIIVQRPDFLADLRALWDKVVTPAHELADWAFLDPIRSDPARYGFTYDPDDLPQPFEKPALFICGRQDDVVGYRDIWRLMDTYPRATLAILDRAGHGIPIQQPALFEALVNKWIDRVEETT